MPAYLLGRPALLGEPKPINWQGVGQALWDSNLNAPIRGVYNLMNADPYTLYTDTGAAGQQAAMDSFDAAGGVTVGSMPIPKPSNSLTMGIGRAKVGGEMGVNNYLYKGGQFLPTTEAPPGTWRVKVNGKNSNIPNGIELIEPGNRTVRPTPFSRSIFQAMGGGSVVNIDEQGVARLNPNINWEYLGSSPDEKLPVKFKNLAASKEQYSTNDLIELYNKGVRWIDTDPLDHVQIIDKALPAKDWLKSGGI